MIIPKVEPLHRESLRRAEMGCNAGLQANTRSQQEQVIAGHCRSLMRAWPRGDAHPLCVHVGPVVQDPGLQDGGLPAGEGALLPVG